MLLALLFLPFFLALIWLMAARITPMGMSFAVWIMLVVVVPCAALSLEFLRWRSGQSSHIFLQWLKPVYLHPLLAMAVFMAIAALTDNRYTMTVGGEYASYGNFLMPYSTVFLCSGLDVPDSTIGIFPRGLSPIIQYGLLIAAAFFWLRGFWSSQKGLCRYGASATWATFCYLPIATILTGTVRACLH